MTRYLSIIGLSLVVLSGCGDPGAHVADASESGSVPLYTNLGNHTYSITTASPVAQQYFDQGLRLTYAFNHPEAIRAFGEAARLDPGCAMCYWGIAYAYGPNINAAMDSAAGVEAYRAVQEASRLATGASEVERALIEALALRYAADPPEDRAALDSAYAAAMGNVRQRFPDDQEVAALHAEALMDLSPWYYWNADGTPRPATPQILDNLEEVIATNPEHPGACHYFIHAVEAVDPERAVPCAERLAGLMPGAGHLVHMPGHIYIRVGRYMDAIRANEHAVHADETFIQDQRPGVNTYVLGYYPHNYDFLAFAAMMAGRAEQAISAARQVESLVPVDLVGQPGLGFLQQGLTGPLRVLVRFGRWDAILNERAPATDAPYVRGTWHYARGMAFTARGELDAATTELAALRDAAEHPDVAELNVGFNMAANVLRVASHTLAGEIAARRGDLATAVDHLQQAVDIEDGFIYGEPPDWPVPARHHLGAVLLQADRAAEAERAYREDLERFPENGWSLVGLASALQAQGRTAEADQVRSRF